MYTMLPLLTHVLYIYVYAYQVGVLKLYLPVVIAHILLPPSYRILLYVYIYTYLVLRSCLTDGQTLP